MRFISPFIAVLFAFLLSAPSCSGGQSKTDLWPTSTPVPKAAAKATPKATAKATPKAAAKPAARATSTPAVVAAVKADESYSVAYVNDVEGECEVKRSGADIAEAVQDIYVPLYTGDTVMTGKDAKMEIVFDDATILKLDGNATLVIRDITRTDKKSTVVELLKGKVMAIVKKLTEKEEFTVRSKMAMAAVKGTEFIVDADEDDPSFGVYEGAVEVSGLDMDGRVMHKVILNKDEETKVIKKLHRPESSRRMGSRFKKRYSEIGDMRGRIEYMREMRRSGQARKFKTQRRLERIDNMRKMYRDNPENYRKLNPRQRQVIDGIIGQEGAYRQEQQREKRSERSQRMKAMLKKHGGRTTDGEQADENGQAEPGGDNGRDQEGQGNKMGQREKMNMNNRQHIQRGKEQRDESVERQQRGQEQAEEPEQEQVKEQAQEEEPTPTPGPEDWHGKKGKDKRDKKGR